MRTTILFMWLSLFCVTANAQCSFDTLSIGVLNTDTLRDSSNLILPCHQFPCDTQPVLCHVWQMPPSFMGVIAIYSNTITPLPVVIQFREGCNLVRMELCRHVYESSVSVWDTLLSFPADCQLCVCNSEEPLTVLIGSYPTFDTLPPVQYNIDTLCGALVGIRDKLSTVRKVSYYRLDTGMEAHVPLSPGLHIQLSGFSRRLIMVR